MQTFNGEKVEQALLQRMLRLLHHRGPDETGFHLDGSVGLAHARLSIIDLGGGQQPIHNEDQTIWITFNGEIFNYVELREELIQKGHRFKTQSDTEVIVHLYEERGEDCVQYLNGQWAFAIWDSKQRKLFLSRDRLGVRPLFYAMTSGAIVFGSEIKSLLAYPGLTREIDLKALGEIFTFWITVPPRTIFKGISELPPGHSLVCEQGRVRIHSYWAPEYGPLPDSLSEEEATGTLLDLLTDAIRIRLRSDVSVGAYLSGGLDSTIIAALIKKISNNPLKTFSISFEDKEFDESEFQREASSFLHTDHHEVRCSSQEIGRIFPDVIWHTEKPVLRMAPAPLFLLSRLVREQGYKVVLTGEGADEMLGGYDIFKEAKIRWFWSRFPESKRRPLLLRRLYPYMKTLQSQPDAYLRAFFHVGKVDVESPFFSHLPRWEMTSKLKLFLSPAVRAAIDAYDPTATLRGLLPARYARWDHFAQSQYLEAQYLLPGYILSSQGDRMAMAHSVEGRFPFLDHRVVEFACRLPSRLKMKVLNEKYILKQAAEGLIPSSIRSRSKQPYRAPDSASLFSSAQPRRFFDYVEELLAPKRIEEDGIFNPSAVEKLAAKARNGEVVGVKDNMALVGILSTQLVVHQFVKSFPRS